MYEIVIAPGRPRTKVHVSIFKSWPGPRFINGKSYNGPVFFIFTEEIAYPKISYPAHQKTFAAHAGGTR